MWIRGWVLGHLLLVLDCPKEVWLNSSVENDVLRTNLE